MKENERRYMIDGIIKDIISYTEEEPKHTFLGSTDRKGYTLKTTLRYMNEYISFYTNVEPYVDMTEEIVKRIEDKAKHRFAVGIYKKHIN